MQNEKMRMSYAKLKKTEAILGHDLFCFNCINYNALLERKWPNLATH